MSVFETYSKRKRRLEHAGQQDPYQYDLFPTAFRNQVVHIWRSAIGRYFRDETYGFAQPSPANDFWELIEDTLSREHGNFALGVRGPDPASRSILYLSTADTAGVLDILELSFRVIDRIVREKFPFGNPQARITQTANDAIEELNHRFLEHRIGYQYSNGEIIRVDSQFIHSEAVKPALTLLAESGFDGPTDEFMKAFDHYRSGRNKEAVADALKAFESTMKAICDARNWPRPANATAKPLLDLLFNNGLIPVELAGHFGALRSAMESGLPTIANRTSRHGQGAAPIAVPPHFAAYALHLAASNIVFLVQAHKSRP